MVVSRHLVVLASFGLLAACGGGKDGGAADSPAATAMATATVPAGGAADGCPRTGHWSECQVKRRLEQSGLAPRDAKDEIEGLPTLDVRPATMMIGTANAALYVFADTMARRRAVSSLDTLKFLVYPKPVGVRREGTVIQHDNLLLVLFSFNDHQRERVSDAITAGAPQP